jgi:hypothetical protein
VSSLLAVRWGIVYRGWRPYPTHEEKERARQERDLEEVRSASTRRDAIAETSYELKPNGDA